MWRVAFRRPRDGGAASTCPDGGRGHERDTSEGWGGDGDWERTMRAA